MDDFECNKNVVKDKTLLGKGSLSVRNNTRQEWFQMVSNCLRKQLADNVT